MATNREEIVVRAGFDNTALASGLRSATSQISGWAKGVSNLVQGAFGYISAAGLVASVEKAFTRVKEIQAGAAKTGLNTSVFQQLSQIANEELPEGAAKFDTAITKLNVNLGKGSKEFEKWGIHSKNAQDAIFEIADKMQGMEDPAAKAAMAVALMGRSGAEMVPLLERGAAALREMSGHKSIFSAEDMENIKNAHQQFEEMGNIVVIWTGKAVSMFAEFFQMLGKLSAPGSLAGASKEEAHQWMEDINKKAAKEAEALESAKDAADAAQDAAKASEIQAEADANATYEAEQKVEAQKKQTEELKQQKDLAEAIAKNEKLAQDYQRNIRSGIAELTAGTVPTLEALAGRQFSRQLGRNYGAGGKFDLETGGGQFGNVARDYLTTQKEAQYDFTYGNKGQYEKDLTKLGGLKGTLMDLGILPDTRDMRNISKATADSEKHLAALNASLKTGAATVSLAPD
jgi:hypothetical protein